MNSKFGLGDRVKIINPEQPHAGEEGVVDAIFLYAKKKPYRIDFTPKFATMTSYEEDDLLLIEKSKTEEDRKIRKAVYYTVNYRAIIEFDPRTESEEDAISSLDIPEGGKHNSEYQDDSFNVYEVEDA